MKFLFKTILVIPGMYVTFNMATIANLYLAKKNLIPI